ncbi:MAG TPA: hypothetical protein PK048_04985 [Candidatus Absconditabacterales bacterium]|nr:hypothetical protein [Candidatus Absconditabacterales bacterium]
MKNIIFLVVGSILLNSFAFASVDRFLVEVSNNPMMLNEAVDLTVKAVDKNGTLVKSFVGDAILNIKGIDEGKYTLPNGGIVTFSNSNQGEVKFHKGIIFKQVGKATITAEDILDDSLFGKLDVEIKDPGATSTLKVIDVTSPIAGATETNKNINIIGMAKDLPNSPLQIIIDGKPNASSSTNTKGEFSVFANELTQGDHTLSVQITNAGGTVVAKSADINFTIGSLENELYKSIKVDPGTTIKEGEKLTLTMETAPEVSTVELMILGNSYYMEKVKSGIFEKKLKFNTANNNVSIDAKLTANGNSKSYTNIETLIIGTGETIHTTSTISEEIDTTTTSTTPTSTIKITSIKSIYDLSSKKYMINRTVEGTPARYLVLLSSNKETIKDNPELIQTTTDKNIIITPPSNTTYYLQVFPADETSNPLGEPSDIIMLTAPSEYKSSAPSCVVDSISLTPMVIAGKHYIVWNKVSGVERYVVYQSSSQSVGVSNMVKLGETVDNKFEFAYDSSAKEATYSHFTVQGICSDGATTNVAGSTKVQVGPWNIAFYCALIAGFVMSGYLLTRKQYILYK